MYRVVVWSKRHFTLVLTLGLLAFLLLVSGSAGASAEAETGAEDWGHQEQDIKDMLFSYIVGALNFLLMIAALILIGIGWALTGSNKKVVILTLGIWLLIATLPLVQVNVEVEDSDPDPEWKSFVEVSILGLSWTGEETRSGEIEYEANTPNYLLILVLLIPLYYFLVGYCRRTEEEGERLRVARNMGPGGWYLNQQWYPQEDGSWEEESGAEAVGKMNYREERP